MTEIPDHDRDDPLSLIMSVLDNGPQGQLVFDELAASGYTIVRANAYVALVEALDIYVTHEVDYMTRNALGDPEKQARVINARAALALAKGEDT